MGKTSLGLDLLSAFGEYVAHEMSLYFTRKLHEMDEAIVGHVNSIKLGSTGSSSIMLLTSARRRCAEQQNDTGHVWMKTMSEMGECVQALLRGVFIPRRLPHAAFSFLTSSLPT